MNHATEKIAQHFCKAQKLQLIKNRNVGKLQYILTNLVPTPYCMCQYAINRNLPVNILFESFYSKNTNYLVQIVIIKAIIY